MNKHLLNYHMHLNGDTGDDLAAYLGIARSTFSLKINEKNAEFTQKEIQAIKDKYSLGAEDVNNIFFAPKVS